MLGIMSKVIGTATRQQSFHSGASHEEMLQIHKNRKQDELLRQSSLQVRYRG